MPGPNSPSLHSTGVGGAAGWSNTANILVFDANYATASRSNMPPGTDTTDLLRAYGFGFTGIVGPVVGIKAEFSAKASESTGNDYVQDEQIKLMKEDLPAGGTPIEVGTNLAKDGLSPWYTVEDYRAYGGSSILWGTTWSAAEIENQYFGLSIQAWIVPSIEPTVTAYVNHVRITVYDSSSPTGQPMAIRSTLAPHARQWQPGMPFRRIIERFYRSPTGVWLPV